MKVCYAVVFLYIFFVSPLSSGRTAAQRFQMIPSKGQYSPAVLTWNSATYTLSNSQGTTIVTLSNSGGASGRLSVFTSTVLWAITSDNCTGNILLNGQTCTVRITNECGGSGRVLTATDGYSAARSTLNGFGGCL